jgi:uncharacterized delta-60 repeat protein
MIKLFLLLICTGFSILANAQNGSLDQSFGNAGVVITDLGQEDNAWSMAIQPDGKIVVGGITYISGGVISDFALVRYNTNGTLDNTFGNNGIVITDVFDKDYAYSLKIQLDGKILLAGYIINKDFAIVRYNTNGTLDNTFGNGGILISDLPGTNGYSRSVALQTDGKIVLAGSIQNFSYPDIVVIRYNTDGSFDNSFGNGGIQTTDIAGDEDIVFTLGLQTDGKIIVSGTSKIGATNPVTVLRYNTDGNLDNTFGNGGIQTTAIGSNSSARSIALQSDGKIVVGAQINTITGDRDFGLIRYNTNGTLDNSFGNGGITLTNNDSLDYCNTVAILSDGKILLGGASYTATSSDFRLDCYNINGTLDNTFGNAGTVLSNIGGHDFGLSLAIQSDGKILMAGYGNNGDFVVLRYIYVTAFPDVLNTFAHRAQEVRCYPNPFSTQTTFQFRAEIHDASVLIYDILGQEVKQLNHVQSNEVKFYRDGLAPGLYSLFLVQENKTIATGSIVVE